MVNKIIGYLCRVYALDFARKDWSMPAYRAANAGEQQAFSARMAPLLAEFEHVRLATYAEVQSRVRFWVPAGLALAAIALVLLTWGDSSHDGLLPALFIGVAGGMYVATNGPVSSYRQAFKSEVVPHLLARFGSFERAAHPKLSVAPLIEAGVLPSNATIDIEDEISGCYRDFAVAMAELRIKRREGDDEVVVFNGMVLEFDLPRDVSGRSVIYPKGWDARGNTAGGGRLGQWFGRRDGMEPVTLESEQFAERYSVSSNDQVGARVLLSPAFMERLSALEAPGDVRGIGRSGNWSTWLLSTVINAHGPMSGIRRLARQHPSLKLAVDMMQVPAGWVSHSGVDDGVVAVAENGRLLIAVPKACDIDYFEPPPYYAAADADAVLMHLSIDIQTMLDVADAVFDLDYRTRVADRGTPLVGLAAA